MILRVSTKTNVNGWRRQITIDFSKRTIKVGPFQFHGGDVEKLTMKQYNDIIEYFKKQGFIELEG